MNYPNWAAKAIETSEQKKAEAEAAQELFKSQENEKCRKLLRVALLSAGIAEPELDILNPVSFDEFIFKVDPSKHEPMYVLEITSPTYYYDSLRPNDHVVRRIDLCTFDHINTVIAYGKLDGDFIVTVGETLKYMLEKVAEGEARYEKYKSRPKLISSASDPWNLPIPVWPTAPTKSINEDDT